VYRMFLLGRNFVSDLICTLKSKIHKNTKKPKKPKNFFLNLGFLALHNSFVFDFFGDHNVNDILICCNYIVLHRTSEQNSADASMSSE